MRGPVPGSRFSIRSASFTWPAARKHVLTQSNLKQQHVEMSQSNKQSQVNVFTTGQDQSTTLRTKQSLPLLVKYWRAVCTIHLLMHSCVQHSFSCHIPSSKLTANVHKTRYQVTAVFDSMILEQDHVQTAASTGWGDYGRDGDNMYKGNLRDNKFFLRNLSIDQVIICFTNLTPA